jgi:hypothetical protein
MEKYIKILKSLLSEPENEHKLYEYINFCITHNTNDDSVCQFHHILPQSLFPQYKNTSWKEAMKWDNTRHELHLQYLKDRYSDEEFMSCFKTTMGRVNADPKKRKKNSLTTKEKWQTDSEFREKMAKRKPKPIGGGSEKMKALWADPIWKAAQLENRKHKREMRKSNETN